MSVTLTGYLSRSAPNADAGPVPSPSVVLAREVDPSDLRRAVRSGELVRIRRGAYHSRAEPTASDPMIGARRRITAVAHQLTADFWFSHESAALVWGLWLATPPTQTHLIQTVNPNRHTDRGIRRHCSELPLDDRDHHAGVPVTSLLRTAVDCAMSLSGAQGLAVVDSALRLGASLVDTSPCGPALDRAGQAASGRPSTCQAMRDELEERIRRSSGRRGVRRARVAATWADEGSESPGESMTRHALLSAGLPRPTTQVLVTTRIGVFRVDLGWPQWKVGIEFDGFVKYADPRAGSAADAVFAEKRRQDALEEAGWIIVRVTWADLKDLSSLAPRVAATVRRRRPTFPAMP